MLIVQFLQKLLRRFVPSPSCGKLAPDQIQFAKIEPVTSATGATIHFNLLFHAEEMLSQNHVPAPRAAQALFWITGDFRMPFDGLTEHFALAFVMFVKFLKFEMIKPNATASLVAHIDDNSTDGHLIQRPGAHGTIDRSMSIGLHGVWLASEMAEVD